MLLFWLRTTDNCFLSAVFWSCSLPTVFFLSRPYLPHLLMGVSVSRLTEVKINVICGFFSICKACYPVLKALQVVWTRIASDKSMWAVIQLLVFFQVLTNSLFEYFSTLVLSLIPHYFLFPCLFFLSSVSCSIPKFWYYVLDTVFKAKCNCY